MKIWMNVKIGRWRVEDWCERVLSRYTVTDSIFEMVARNEESQCDVPRGSRTTVDETTRCGIWAV